MEDARSELHELSKWAFRYTINLDGRVSHIAGGAALGGSHAIVYEGTLVPDGTKVAIKSLRSGPGKDPAALKRIIREVNLWSKLCHENIVPLLGISTEFDFTISIISAWMPLGNAHDYVQNIANDPRPLLRDIASGLHYLHSCSPNPVFHGNLKGSNVLVSSGRRALLTDFGLSVLVESTFSMPLSKATRSGFSWMALELLDDNTTSAASDVWAYGMTMLELFTRTSSFSRHSSPALMIKLYRREVPSRPPAELTQFRLTDAWWEICTSCCRFEPSLRPNIAAIVQATISPTKATLMSQPPPLIEQDRHSPDATHQQYAMDLSSVLDKLCNQASTHNIVLNGQISRNLGTNPLCGSTAIVYQGTLTPSGNKVAIKAFYRTMSGTEAELKSIFREADVWSNLHHQNVVRVFGISTEFDSTISIISEWMPLGNAYTYIQDIENDPWPLLGDIASGLYYLHSHKLGPVVHGDLKGLNVLVSSDRRALLSDFGLVTLNISTFSMAVDAICGGSSHWMAPELLDDFPPSMASDVWAFGMTTLELFTRAVPFSDCRNSVNVFRRIMEGKLPLRPTDESTQFRLSNTWWEICTSCWRHEPSSHPTMKDIIEKVKIVITYARPILLPLEASTSREADSHPILQQVTSDHEVNRGDTTIDKALKGNAPMQTTMETTMEWLAFDTAGLGAHWLYIRSDTQQNHSDDSVDLK
ncbi:kinase-like domain-containing protein [Pisolithus marmoratus]|nr:kinase-like domain-containing protein [Pisolithus marmoratus]